MATRIGIVSLSGCSYELAYDLLSQSSSSNSSQVRLYGILHVTGTYVSWSSGSASVHTSGLQAIGTYYSRGDYTVITRDFTFSHDSNGNFSAYIGASLSTTFVSGSCGGTLTLPKINRKATVTSATDMTDESNPSASFSNPGNMSLIPYINFYLNNAVALRLERTKGSYTSPYNWEITEEERQQIRTIYNKVNSSTYTIGFDSYSGSTQTGYSSLTKNITIINANPIFSDFSFEDTNTTTLALTGNNQNIINGYSNIKATISTSNKAIAQKEATMTKYRLSIGDKTTDITYSDEESVNGTINNVGSGIFNVYAIDSRNNSTMVTKNASNIINYESVYIDKDNSSFTRNNNSVGENGILKINGTFWNNSFGSVSNSVSASYRFKKSDSETWITGTTTITLTLDGNNYSFEGQIAGDNQDTTWDLDSSYNLEVTIEDELTTATISLILASAIPTISLDKKGVGIMCGFDENLGGLLQVGGKVVGEIQISSTEIKTNEVWVDSNNKKWPIYKMTYYVSSLPNNTATTYQHGISNAKLIWADMSNSFILWSTGNTAPFNYISVATGTVTYNPMIELRAVNSSTFEIRTSTNRSSLSAYVTLKYTKTTD